MSKSTELREELDKVFRYEERYRETGYIHPDVEDWEEAVWRNRFAILAALEIAERGQWVKCEQRMPEAGKRVLFKEQYGDPVIGFYQVEARRNFWETDYSQHGEFSGWDGSVSSIESRLADVTHWMPLPLAPEEK